MNVDHIRNKFINNNNFFIHEVVFLKNMLHDAKEKNITVLDFGGSNLCTFQNYIKPFRYSNKFIITTLDKQQKNHNVQYKYVKYDGINIPYPNNYFDVVICNFSLHHISLKNRHRIFGELSRVCKYKLIILEDILLNKIGFIISKIHFICFKQSPRMTNCMHSPEEWINIMSHYKFKSTRSINIRGNKPGITHVMLFFDKVI